MKKLWMLFSVILVLSCTKKTEPIPLSFYYWKTNFQLTETEKQYLNDLDVAKLYIRYFDISLKDSIAIPVAPVVFNQNVVYLNLRRLLCPPLVCPILINRRHSLFVDGLA